MRVPHLDFAQELEAEAAVDAQHHIQLTIVNTHILYSHITPNPIRSFDDVAIFKYWHARCNLHQRHASAFNDEPKRLE